MVRLMARIYTFSPPIRIYLQKNNNVCIYVHYV